MDLAFTKAEALGNDFIIVDNSDGSFELSEDDIVALCNRRLGVGADGVLILQATDKAALGMRILNADGGEAETCGNGLRAIAKYAFDKGLVHDTSIDIETQAGVKKAEIQTNKTGRAVNIRVDLGTPVFERALIPMLGKAGEVVGEKLTVGDTELEITSLSLGNPHTVIFVMNAESAPVDVFGPAIEGLNVFPSRTNVEFVEIIARDYLRMRVWERGAGETMACGTGAAAALIAAVKSGIAERRATVSLPGGDLTVEWRDDDHAYITGGATIVFSGVVDASWMTDKKKGSNHE